MWQCKPLLSGRTKDRQKYTGSPVKKENKIFIICCLEEQAGLEGGVEEILEVKAAEE